ncbi:unnamed protein product [Owenia fusiformis]|uniref:Uncharacterized protein n=1 Tax=Owenia fusiformis TaxID=6347 RepID=A0A8J1TCI6_OWEFU|nr:unnamed protein product [Owenia fusiformis]
MTKMYLLLMVHVFAYCNGANILLAPLDVGYNSRVTNMIKIGDILQQRGHKINFLYTSELRNTKLFKMAGKKMADAVNRFNVITYKVPPEDPAVAEATDTMDWLDSFIGLSWSDIVKMYWPYTYPEHLNNAIQDMDTWKKLSEQSFDVIIADANNYFGRVLGGHFNVPVIVYSNWGPMGHDFIYPINPSYIPVDFTNPYLSDKMDIWERFLNTWEYLRFHYYAAVAQEMVKEVCLKFKHIKTAACDNIVDFPKTVSLVLMNRNDALHYPAPFMPHIISIDGYFLDKAKPLSGKFKDIVEKANNDGVIVVSLGSIFRKLPMDMAEAFAEALATMKQTVIWSYDGPKPKQLGDNTFVSEWIPQRDLLAHSKVKLFVQHCGISATFEALDSAVPNVGIPLIADQPYNCEKLANRVGSLKVIDPRNLTSEVLRSAMTEVLYNTTYEENAKKAAAIYHSQPISPKDKVAYWVEYVIRHKGAPHLRSQGANNLNIFQYYLLDIIGLFVVIACVISGIIIYFISFIVKKFIHSPKKDKAE